MQSIRSKLQRNIIKVLDRMKTLFITGVDTSIEPTWWGVKTTLQQMFWPSAPKTQQEN